MIYDVAIIGGGIGGLMNKLTNTEVVTIKTDTKWGDLYAIAIQNEFVDYDKYDITFRAYN